MPVSLTRSWISRGSRNQTRSRSQPAALGHGIPGVDGQVHQDLVDLSGVGVKDFRRQDRARFRVESLRRGHAPASSRNCAPVHSGPRPAARRAGLAEDQQAASQVGCPLGRFVDLGKRFVQVVGRMHLAHSHAGVSGDHGQQIVEIVRHRAGQPSDAFHLLGPMELRSSRWRSASAARSSRRARASPISLATAGARRVRLLFIT